MAAAVRLTCPASRSSCGPTRSSSITCSSKLAGADSSSAATATGAASANRRSLPATRIRSGQSSPMRSRSRPVAATCWFPTSAMTSVYFTLRTQLIPYLYTYAWLAHRESLPILRPLYLKYPQLEEAYRHSHEYFFGDEMLVAPVHDPSGDQTIYLPPGQWIDFFNGRRYAGGGTFTAHYAVDETPVFVREGALIPEQGVSDYSNAKPLDTLILNVYGSGQGRFDLYEDDGVSLAYDKEEYAVTALTYATG